MRSIEQIQADIKTLDAARAAERSHNRRINNIQNEGGEGFDCDEAASQRYSAASWELQKELFAATWTPEVYESRKAAWNAGLSGCKSQHDVNALQDRLGFTVSDIRRAKEMLLSATEA